MKPSPFHSHVGVGLRTPHMDYFLQHKPKLSWLEIHSENYFQPNSLERQQLLTLAQDYEISCHGIGLSLGSVSRVSQSHLTRLNELISQVSPMFVSDHFKLE